MKIKSIILSMLAAAAIVSCQKVEPNTVPKDGEPAYAKFILTLPSTTKSDPNAAAEEQKINTIDILIYGGGVLESVTRFTPSGNATPGDGTFGENTGTITTANIATTTGTKDIIAVINKNDVVALPALTTEMADFYKVEFTLGVAAAGSSGVLATAPIADENNFVMVGRDEGIVIEASHNASSPAKATISLDRISAKFNLKLAPTIPLTAAISKAGVTAATNVEFAIAQTNLSTYLYRTTPLTPGGSNSVNGLKYDHVTLSTEALVYVSSIDDFTAANMTFANSKYGPENVNNKPVAGNTTFAVIKTKMAPTKFLAAATPDNDPETLQPDGAGTFWGVREKATNKIVYAPFNLYASANTAITTKFPSTGTQYEVVTYTTGIVYFRMNINQTSLQEASYDTPAEYLTAKYSVRNNYAYKITITAIEGWGHEAPAKLYPANPDAALEVTAQVKAEIVLTPWVSTSVIGPIGG